MLKSAPFTPRRTQILRLLLRHKPPLPEIQRMNPFPKQGKLQACITCRLDASKRVKRKRSEGPGCGWRLAAPRGRRDQGVAGGSRLHVVGGTRVWLTAHPGRCRLAARGSASTFSRVAYDREVVGGRMWLTAHSGGSRLPTSRASWSVRLEPQRWQECRDASSPLPASSPATTSSPPPAPELALLNVGKSVETPAPSSQPAPRPLPPAGELALLKVGKSVETPAPSSQPATSRQAPSRQAPAPRYPPRSSRSSKLARV
jgi:hypothetical protein